MNEISQLLKDFDAWQARLGRAMASAFDDGRIKIANHLAAAIHHSSDVRAAIASANEEQA
jgi:hypothetical protein